jgi:hypothetical protein
LKSLEATEETMLNLSVLTLGQYGDCGSPGRDPAEAKRKGKTLSVIDGLLAATALHHNLTVVSRNASDFMDVQLRVLNPWEG